MISSQIATFIRVAECGSFSKAAQALGVSAVSVMKQMNALEERLDVGLFERTTRGAALSAAGRSLYADAAEISALASRAIQKAREIDGANPFEIRIGTSLLRPCRALMEQWTKINAGRLDFAVRLVPFEDNPAGMKSMFEKLGGDIDLFVSPCDSRTWRQKYAVEPLETVECTVAMSRSHPLAQKNALSWDDLAGQTLMLLQRGESELLDALRDEILREHKDITIIDTEFYDAEVFNHCQRDGCLMESLSLWDGVHPSIVNVKAPWQIRMPYGIVHAKNPPLEVQSFLQVLKE